MAIELWSLFAASAARRALAAIYSSKPGVAVVDTFHDISTSNDATPLWLPQLSMAVGTAVILAIAFIDELVLELPSASASCRPVGRGFAQ